MAHKRMFSKDITESDAFADMPLSSQALYFHLGMEADDDGFINNAKKVQRGIGASPDDLNLLIAKNFIIPFKSGVVVIKHWRINNTIRNDRKNDTKYSEEMSLLTVKNNGAYTLSSEPIQLPPVINNDDIGGDDVDDDSTQETMRQKAYRESDLPYSFSYKIRNAFYGEPCPICGCVMQPCADGAIGTDAHKPTIQHNVPISKGGKHELGNISVICHSCNVTLQEKETGKLNSEQVIDVWDGICRADARQMPVRCPSNDGIDIDIDIDIEEDRYTLSGKPDCLPVKVREIVDYLNAAIGSSYRPSSKKTTSLIRARLNEGFTVDDFKAVIDKKSASWGGTDMAKYLRPETLFGTKFEGYLNEPTRGAMANEFAKYD